MSAFYEGIADFFEVDPAVVSAEFDLRGQEIPWDSLAIVLTIALVDNCYSVMLDGKALADCVTVADIEKLIDAAKKA